MSYSSMYIGQHLNSARGALQSFTSSSKLSSTAKLDQKVGQTALSIIGKLATLASNFKSSVISLCSKISEAFHPTTSTIPDGSSPEVATPTEARDQLSIPRSSSATPTISDGSSSEVATPTKARDQLSTPRSSSATPTISDGSSSEVATPTEARDQLFTPRSSSVTPTIPDGPSSEVATPTEASNQPSTPRSSSATPTISDGSSSEVATPIEASEQPSTSKRCAVPKTARQIRLDAYASAQRHKVTYGSSPREGNAFKSGLGVDKYTHA